MSLEKPKKPKSNRKKSTKLSTNTRKQWQDIIKKVDKKDIPIELVYDIVVKMVDGTTMVIDVKEIVDNGAEPEEVESMLNDKFEELDQYIESVDFFINIDSVVGSVKPITDDILKGLK
jgi:hypothetical protein